MIDEELCRTSGGDPLKDWGALGLDASILVALPFNLGPGLNQDALGGSRANRTTVGSGAPRLPQVTVDPGLWILAWPVDLACFLTPPLWVGV